jgi:hypothetical protein
METRKTVTFDFPPGQTPMQLGGQLAFQHDLACKFDELGKGSLDVTESELVTVRKKLAQCGIIDVVVKDWTGRDT